MSADAGPPRTADAVRRWVRDRSPQPFDDATVVRPPGDHQWWYGPGQYELAVMGTAADSNDPDDIANFIDGSLSPSYVRSYGLKIDRITELLVAGRAEFDQAKRRDIYREVERIAIEQAPIVGLTWQR